MHACKYSYSTCTKSWLFLSLFLGALCASPSSSKLSWGGKGSLDSIPLSLSLPLFSLYPNITHTCTDERKKRSERRRKEEFA